MKSIQDAIIGLPIKGQLLEQIRLAISNSSYKRWIFRSSTNAEDLEGFNAAGLYDSIPVSVDPLRLETIEEAIKIVWASLWNVRAFLERQAFEISSSAVAMAVLIQPFFADDALEANGVAVTENPFDKAKYGAFVTSFKGGAHRATDVNAGDLGEQVMIHMSRKPGSFEPELIARGKTPGAVLTQAMIDSLGEGCRVLHELIIGKKINLSQSRPFCLNVEFLVLKATEEGGKPQVLFIQARPSAVTSK